MVPIIIATSINDHYLTIVWPNVFRLLGTRKRNYFTWLTMKAGLDIEDDSRRAGIIREEIGWDDSSLGASPFTTPWLQYYVTFVCGMQWSDRPAENCGPWCTCKEVHPPPPQISRACPFRRGKGLVHFASYATQFVMQYLLLIICERHNITLQCKL